MSENNDQGVLALVGWKAMAALLIVGMLVLAGCSAIDTGSNASDDEQSEATNKQGEFLGFDPESSGGEQLEASTLEQMVEEAKEETPPKNGDEYLFGFANLQRDIAFAIKVEDSIEENAEAAGLELAIADNQLSGQTALENANSFVSRNTDYVVEFQTDAEFGPTIMDRFNQADIPVIAIDIPMPGATFVGVNNPRAGFMGGSYLAQASQAKWGDEVQEGYFVIGELPQSGAIPALRTEGQEQGFLAATEGFPEDQVIKIDTKNTLEESFTQMSNVLGRIPDGVPIMVTAINDQSATGMLRAVKSAGRQDDVLVVGLGADELDTLGDEDRLIASVGTFPERYGNYIIPTALMQLAGYEVPEAVLVNSEMVSTENVCDFYPDRQCRSPEAAPDFQYEFPQQAFDQFVDSIRDDPAYEDVQYIIKK